MDAERWGDRGLLQRLFLVSLPSVSYAVFFTSHSWPGWAAWAVVGGVRIRHRDRKVLWDSALLGALYAWGKKDSLVRDGIQLWVTTKLSRNVLVGIVALATSAILYYQQSKDDLRDPLTDEKPEEIRAWILEHPQPLIFPCQTTHTRIFPKKHAFGYSYLLYGHPVIPSGVATNARDISNGRDRSLGFWWLCVRAKDYLKRGQSSLGFYDKLQSFLREQNVDDSEWSYAYLVTAPRFLGYAFNPVSFWYIYDSDHKLKKMILEVNNTFGERRNYLLDGYSLPSPPRASASEDSELAVRKDTFTDMWMKDFHVSPFNSRNGAYSLKAFNPFPSPNLKVSKIDNTITLKSSKDHAKIVARVFTTGEPIDPSNIGVLGIVRFVGGWWWIGLSTFPRIIKEAFKLYFQRSLHVWFRPEVAGTSIGRVPTATEAAIENIFRDYLDHTVKYSGNAIELYYEPAIPDKPQLESRSIHRTPPNEELKRLDIRVSTPAFYSRLVHYAYTSEAFDREHTFTDEKNRTLWISRPEILLSLCPNRSSKRRSPELSLQKRGYFDELRWKVLKRLRCPPPDPAYPITPESTNSAINDIRTLSYSDLDQFVRGIREDAGLYRRLVTKIFLARRFTLGYTEVIDLIDFGIRFALCWLSYKSLVSWERDGRGQVIANVTTATRIIAICACHMYGLLKGYR